MIYKNFYFFGLKNNIIIYVIINYYEFNNL